MRNKYLLRLLTAVLLTALLVSGCAKWGNEDRPVRPNGEESPVQEDRRGEDIPPRGDLDLTEYVAALYEDILLEMGHTVQVDHEGQITLLTSTVEHPPNSGVYDYWTS